MKAKDNRRNAEKGPRFLKMLPRLLGSIVGGRRVCDKKSPGLISDQSMGYDTMNKVLPYEDRIGLFTANPANEISYEKLSTG